MRVYLGADHAGFELKNQIADHLRANGHEVVDCGAYVYDAADDYPASVSYTHLTLPTNREV